MIHCGNLSSPRIKIVVLVKFSICGNEHLMQSSKFKHINTSVYTGKDKTKKSKDN